MRLCLSVVLAVFLSWMASSARAQVQEIRSEHGEPSRAGALQHHADHGLVIAGSVTLAVGWASNTVGALAGGLLWPHDVGEGYAVSLIPVLGPVIWGTWGLTFLNENTANWLAAFAYIDAAVQGVGLGLLIAGLVGVDDPIPQVADGVHLLPMASAGSVGLVTTGAF